MADSWSLNPVVELRDSFESLPDVLRRPIEMVVFGGDLPRADISGMRQLAADLRANGAELGGHSVDADSILRQEETVGELGDGLRETLRAHRDAAAQLDGTAGALADQAQAAANEAEKTLCVMFAFGIQLAWKIFGVLSSASAAGPAGTVAAAPAVESMLVAGRSRVAMLRAALEQALRTGAAGTAARLAELGPLRLATTLGRAAALPVAVDAGVQALQVASGDRTLDIIGSDGTNPTGIDPTSIKVAALSGAGGAAGGMLAGWFVPAAFPRVAGSRLALGLVHGTAGAVTGLGAAALVTGWPKHFDQALAPLLNGAFAGAVYAGTPVPDGGTAAGPVIDGTGAFMRPDLPTTAHSGDGAGPTAAGDVAASGRPPVEVSTESRQAWEAASAAWAAAPESGEPGVSRVAPEPGTNGNASLLAGITTSRPSAMPDFLPTTEGPGRGAAAAETTAGPVGRAESAAPVERPQRAEPAGRTTALPPPTSVAETAPPPKVSSAATSRPGGDMPDRAAVTTGHEPAGDAGPIRSGKPSVPGEGSGAETSTRVRPPMGSGDGPESAVRGEHRAAGNEGPAPSANRVNAAAEPGLDNRAAESGPANRTAESGPDHRAAESGPDHRAAESGPDHRAAESGPDNRAAEPGPDNPAAARSPETTGDGPDASASADRPPAHEGPGHDPTPDASARHETAAAATAETGDLAGSLRSPREQAVDLLADFHASSDAAIPEHLRLHNLSDDALRAGLFHSDEKQSMIATVEIIRRGTISDAVPGGMVLRVQQAEGVYALGKRPVEMKPGEGKSLMFMAAAMQRAVRDGSCLLVTTTDGLAHREFAQYRQLMTDYGIDVFRADQQQGFGPVADGRPAVVVATGETVGHLCNAGHLPPRRALIDEIDGIIDRGERQFLRSEGADRAAPEATAREVFAAHDFLADARASGALSHADFGLRQITEQVGMRPDRTPEIESWYDGQASLTPEGLAKVEALPGGKQWLAGMGQSRLETAAAAEFTTRNKTHYVMDTGKIVIIDQGEHGLQRNPTTSSESRWSAEPGQASLAQAVEAKEIRTAERAGRGAEQHRIEVRADAESATRIDSVEIYRKDGKFFDEVTGASGTLADLNPVLEKIYGLEGAHQVDRSQAHRLVEGVPDVVENTHGKLSTIGESAYRMWDGGSGRAQEILCHRNDLVERQVAALVREGVPREAIEAVDADRIAGWGAEWEVRLQRIFDEAGEQGKILVINRQGQRGVDISVSEEVQARGGMHVWLTEAPEQSYISEQAKNRTARNGDLGTAQVVLSPQDALIRNAMHLHGVREAVVHYEQAVAAHRSDPSPEHHSAVLAAGNELRSLTPELQQRALRHSTADFIRHHAYTTDNPALTLAAAETGHHRAIDDPGRGDEPADRVARLSGLLGIPGSVVADRFAAVEHDSAGDRIRVLLEQNGIPSAAAEALQQHVTETAPAAVVRNAAYTDEEALPQLTLQRDRLALELGLRIADIEGAEGLRTLGPAVAEAANELARRLDYPVSAVDTTVARDILGEAVDQHSTGVRTEQSPTSGESAPVADDSESVRRGVHENPAAEDIVAAASHYLATVALFDLATRIHRRNPNSCVNNAVTAMRVLCPDNRFAMPATSLVGHGRGVVQEVFGSTLERAASLDDVVESLKARPGGISVLIYKWRDPQATDSTDADNHMVLLVNDSTSVEHPNPVVVDLAVSRNGDSAMDYGVHDLRNRRALLNKAVGYDDWRQRQQKFLDKVPADKRLFETMEFDHNGTPVSAPRRWAPPDESLPPEQREAVPSAMVDQINSVFSNGPGSGDVLPGLSVVDVAEPPGAPNSLDRAEPISIGSRPEEEGDDHSTGRGQGPDHGERGLIGSTPDEGAEVPEDGGPKASVGPTDWVLSDDVPRTVVTLIRALTKEGLTRVLAEPERAREIIAEIGGRFDSGDVPSKSEGRTPLTALFPAEQRAYLRYSLERSIASACLQNRLTETALLEMMRRPERVTAALRAEYSGIEPGYFASWLDDAYVMHGQDGYSRESGLHGFMQAAVEHLTTVWGLVDDPVSSELAAIKEEGSRARAPILERIPPERRAELDLPAQTVDEFSVDGDKSVLTAATNMGSVGIVLRGFLDSLAAHADVVEGWPWASVQRSVLQFASRLSVMAGVTFTTLGDFTEPRRPPEFAIGFDTDAQVITSIVVTGEAKQARIRDRGGVCPGFVNSEPSGAASASAAAVRGYLREYDVEPKRYSSGSNTAMMIGGLLLPLLGRDYPQLRLADPTLSDHTDTHPETGEVGSAPHRPDRSGPTAPPGSIGARPHDNVGPARDREGPGESVRNGTRGTPWTRPGHQEADPAPLSGSDRPSGDRAGSRSHERDEPVPGDSNRPGTDGAEDRIGSRPPDGEPTPVDSVHGVESRAAARPAGDFLGPVDPRSGLPDYVAPPVAVREAAERVLRRHWGPTETPEGLVYGWRRQSAAKQAVAAAESADHSAANARIVAALSEDDLRVLMRTWPEFVGRAGGFPRGMRDEANRWAFAKARAELAESAAVTGGTRREQRLREYLLNVEDLLIRAGHRAAAVETPGTPAPTVLLESFDAEDPRGGSAIISFGRPDAVAEAWHVDGSAGDLRRMDQRMQLAANHYEVAARENPDRPVRVVVWSGTEGHRLAGDMAALHETVDSDVRSGPERQLVVHGDGGRPTRKALAHPSVERTVDTLVVCGESNVLAMRDMLTDISASMDVYFGVAARTNSPAEAIQVPAEQFSCRFPSAEAGQKSAFVKKVRESVQRQDRPAFHSGKGADDEFLLYVDDRGKVATESLDNMGRILAGRSDRLTTYDPDDGPVGFADYIRRRPAASAYDDVLPREPEFGRPVLLASDEDRALAGTAIEKRGGPDADPQVLSHRGLPDDFTRSARLAVDNRRWWHNLSAEERRAVVAVHPEIVGNAPGVPSEVADYAHDLWRGDTFAAVYAKGSTGADPSERLIFRNLYAVSEGLTRASSVHRDVPAPIVSTVRLTPDAFGGNGSGVVSIGNCHLDQAEHVVWYVDGVDTRLQTAPDRMLAARNLYEEMVRADRSRKVAVVSWLGYEAPANNKEAWAARPELAEAGGRVFARDVLALRAVSNAEFSVLGYSYGTPTVSEATVGARLDGAFVHRVLVGSPGLGRRYDSATDASSRYRWVLAQSDDPVTGLGTDSPGLRGRMLGDGPFGLGTDPATDTTATRLPAERGFPDSLDPFDGHGYYLEYTLAQAAQPSEALRSAAWCLAGRGSELVPEPHRPTVDDPPLRHRIRGSLVDNAADRRARQLDAALPGRGEAQSPRTGTGPHGKAISSRRAAAAPVAADTAGARPRIGLQFGAGRIAEPGSAYPEALDLGVDTLAVRVGGAAKDLSVLQTVCRSAVSRGVTPAVVLDVGPRWSDTEVRRKAGVVADIVGSYGIPWQLHTADPRGLAAAELAPDCHRVVLLNSLTMATVGVRGAAGWMARAVRPAVGDIATVLAEAQRAGASGVAVPRQLLSEEFVRQADTAGLRLAVWGVSGSGSMRAVLAQGVDEVWVDGVERLALLRAEVVESGLGGGRPEQYGEPGNDHPAGREQGRLEQQRPDGDDYAGGRAHGRPGQEGPDDGSRGLIGSTPHEEARPPEDGTWDETSVSPADWVVSDDVPRTAVTLIRALSKEGLSRVLAEPERAREIITEIGRRFQEGEVPSKSDGRTQLTELFPADHLAYLRYSLERSIASGCLQFRLTEVALQHMMDRPEQVVAAERAQYSDVEPRYFASWLDDDYVMHGQDGYPRASGRHAFMQAAVEHLTTVWDLVDDPVSRELAAIKEEGSRNRAPILTAIPPEWRAELDLPAHTVDEFSVAGDKSVLTAATNMASVGIVLRGFLDSLAEHADVVEGWSWASIQHSVVQFASRLSVMAGITFTTLGDFTEPRTPPRFAIDFDTAEQKITSIAITGETKQARIRDRGGVCPGFVSFDPSGAAEPSTAQLRQSLRDNDIDPKRTSSGSNTAMMIGGFLLPLLGRDYPHLHLTEPTLAHRAAARPEAGDAEQATQRPDRAGPPAPPDAIGARPHENSGPARRAQRSGEPVGDRPLGTPWSRSGIQDTDSAPLTGSGRLSGAETGNVGPSGTSFARPRHEPAEPDAAARDDAAGSGPHERDEPVPDDSNRPRTDGSEGRIGSRPSEGDHMPGDPVGAETRAAALASGGFLGPVDPRSGLPDYVPPVAAVREAAERVLRRHWGPAATPAGLVYGWRRQSAAKQAVAAEEAADHAAANALIVAGLSEGDLRVLVRAWPEFVGRAGGFPRGVRDEANRWAFAKARSELEESAAVTGGTRREQRLREYLRNAEDLLIRAGQHAAAVETPGVAAPTVLLEYFDPVDPGAESAIVSFGRPDAVAEAWHVDGSAGNLRRLDQRMQLAANHYEVAARENPDRPVRVVVWSGTEGHRLAGDMAALRGAVGADPGPDVQRQLVVYGNGGRSARKALAHQRVARGVADLVVCGESNLVAMRDLPPEVYRSMDVYFGAADRTTRPAEAISLPGKQFSARFPSSEAGQKTAFIKNVRRTLRRQDDLPFQFGKEAADEFLLYVDDRGKAPTEALDNIGRILAGRPERLTVYDPDAVPVTVADYIRRHPPASAYGDVLPRDPDSGTPTLRGTAPDHELARVAIEKRGGPDARPRVLSHRGLPDDFTRAARLALDNRRWWYNLAAEERRAMVAVHPEIVGNAPGIPAEVVDYAHDLWRSDVFAAIGAKGSAEADPSEHRTFRNLYAVNEALTWASAAHRDVPAPIVSTFRLEPDAFGGNGSGMFAVGNCRLDEAEHVVWFVDGVDTRLQTAPDRVTSARNLYEEMMRAAPSGKVAVVSWIGYEAPANNKEILSGRPVLAESGGRLLARDVLALRAVSDAEFSVLGFSYGTPTVSEATVGGRLDGVFVHRVLVGSPGLGRRYDSATDASSRYRWVLAQSDDPVTALGAASPGLRGRTLPDGPFGLGTDPATDTTATRVPSERGFPQILANAGGHSEYLKYSLAQVAQPSESLRSAAWCLAGRGSELVPDPHRVSFTDPSLRHRIRGPLIDEAADRRARPLDAALPWSGETRPGTRSGSVRQPGVDPVAEAGPTVPDAAARVRPTVGIRVGVDRFAAAAPPDMKALEPGADTVVVRVDRATEDMAALSAACRSGAFGDATPAIALNTGPLWSDTEVRTTVARVAELMDVRGGVWELHAFDHRVLRAASELAPGVRRVAWLNSLTTATRGIGGAVGWMARAVYPGARDIAAVLDESRHAGASGVAVPRQLLSQEFVRQADAAGLRLAVWGVTGSGSMRAVLAHGVDEVWAAGVDRLALLRAEVAEGGFGSRRTERSAEATDGSVPDGPPGRGSLDGPADLIGARPHENPGPTSDGGPGRVARALIRAAEPFTPESMPPNEVLAWSGFAESDVRSIRELAAAHGFIVDLRSSNRVGLGWRDAGALPKPEWLSYGTGTDLDILLGLDPVNLGLAVIFEPELPPRTPDIPDAPWRILVERYQERLKDWESFKASRPHGRTPFGSGAEITEFGKVDETGAVYRNGDDGRLRPVTSDYDVVAIRELDGRLVSSRSRYQDCMQILMSRNLPILHGAQSQWLTLSAGHQAKKVKLGKRVLPGGEPAVRIEPGRQLRAVWGPSLDELIGVADVPNEDRIEEFGRRLPPPSVENLSDYLYFYNMVAGRNIQVLLENIRRTVIRSNIVLPEHLADVLGDVTRPALDHALRRLTGNLADELHDALYDWRADAAESMVFDGPAIVHLAVALREVGRRPDDYELLAVGSGTFLQATIEPGTGGARQLRAIGDEIGRGSPARHPESAEVLIREQGGLALQNADGPVTLRAYLSGEPGYRHGTVAISYTSTEPARPGPGLRSAGIREQRARDGAQVTVSFELDELVETPENGPAPVVERGLPRAEVPGSPRTPWTRPGRPRPALPAREERGSGRSPELGRLYRFIAADAELISRHVVWDTNAKAFTYDLPDGRVAAVELRTDHDDAAAVVDLKRDYSGHRHVLTIAMRTLRAETWSVDIGRAMARQLEAIRTYDQQYPTISPAWNAARPAALSRTLMCGFAELRYVAESIGRAAADRLPALNRSLDELVIGLQLRPDDPHSATRMMLLNAWDPRSRTADRLRELRRFPAPDRDGGSGWP